jgi:hypothetical protein
MEDPASGELRSSQVGLAAALVSLTASALLLGNLLLARVHGGAIQATLVLGLLLFAVPAAALTGAGMAARELGSRRLGVGRGRDAGSAIKIGMVVVIGAGLLVTLVGLQLSHGPLTSLFPVPQSGALFFYRVGTALPALGALAILSAGLLIVDRSWVLLPGLVLAAAVDLWLASRWLYRGASDVGFELAGVGLALPVALLLAATAAGGLLLASGRARNELAIHLARPFHMADAGALLRESPWTLAGAPLIAAWICLLSVVMARGEARGDLLGPVMALFACVTMLVLSLELGTRVGAAGRPGPLLMAASLGLLGSVLVVAPGALLFPLVPGLAHGSTSMVAPRLLGSLALIELVFHLLAWAGLLARRHPLRIELAVVGVLSAGAAVGLLWLGRHGAVPLLMTLLLVRAAALPVLRR